MAKKVRKRSEEDDDPAFEFPEFDEKGFYEHEFEQLYATLLAFLFGVLLGGLAFAVGRIGLPVEAPFGAGLAGTVLAAFVIQRLRPESAKYTKGDWATLGALMFFSFLGIWFLLADLIR